jgi:hypothetical protein
LVARLGSVAAEDVSHGANRSGRACEQADTRTRVAVDRVVSGRRPGRGISKKSIVDRSLLSLPEGGTIVIPDPPLAIASELRMVTCDPAKNSIPFPLFDDALK